MTTHELQSLREPLIKDERDVFGDPDSPDDILSFDRQSFRNLPARLLAKAVSKATPGNALKLSRRFAYALTPQLVRSHYYGDHAKKPKQFPTSYLNGLRGITSIKVFTFHYVFAYTDICFQPWGTDDRHNYFLELPIIRYFYAGFTAHLFFAIAGYLTSVRLFQMIDQHDQASQSKVLKTVSGALFRRALRLYLPVLCITLLTAHYIHLGLYETNRQYIADVALFPGEWNEPKPEMFPSYYIQIRYWMREMFDLTNIFDPGAVYPYHDQHLWSILAELKGSLCTYMVLMGTAQCQKYVRLAALCLMTYMFFLWNHWEVWVYILGAIVAQIDLLLNEREAEKKLTLDPDRQLPPSPPHSPKPGHKPAPPTWAEYLSNPPSNFVTVALRAFGFLTAFYFLSYPIDGWKTYAPGYMTLNKLIPEWMDRKDKFYPNIGSALLIFLLARAHPDTSKWRRIFNSGVAQYLGKISFALYLVHGPILHAIGYMIPHRIWWFMGIQQIDTGDYTWAATIFVGWAVSLTLSLWAADVWTREVESRCVRVVQKLEGWSFVKS
jgi:peptidoglycan/LPS O-acetylase OafA/YrhL